MARSFQARGFNAFKYHTAVSFDGIVDEMRVLRDEVRRLDAAVPVYGMKTLEAQLVGYLERSPTPEIALEDGGGMKRLSFPPNALYAVLQ